jgi:hypothetical protein
MVVVGWPNEVISAEVYPPNWTGPEFKLVDVLLPLRSLIIEYDGPSHFEPMASDRAQPRSKWDADRAFDVAACNQGYKALRLHYRDERLFPIFIAKAIAECHDKSVLYTPSYAPLPPSAAA